MTSYDDELGQDDTYREQIQALGRAARKRRESAKNVLTALDELVAVRNRIKRVDEKKRLLGIGTNDDRYSKDYEKWKIAVFDLDDWKCINCDSTSNLQAHHVKKYRDHGSLRLDVGNGITLCRKCHWETTGIERMLKI